MHIPLPYIFLICSAPSFRRGRPVSRGSGHVETVRGLSFQDAFLLDRMKLFLSLSLSRHFQISHQRLVLRKLGLIANNNKRIPTANRTSPMTLILCVFIIMVNCPSCDHASQTPTIANTALRIRFIFTPSLTRLILDDLTKKFWIHRLVISRTATSLSF
jgi:hypothetical protein